MMWDGKKNAGAEDFLRCDGEDPRAHRRRSAEAVQESCRERQAAARSEDAARGRRQLPGADRGAAEPPHQPGDPLDSDQRPVARPKRACRKSWPTS